MANACYFVAKLVAVGSLQFGGKSGTVPLFYTHTINQHSRLAMWHIQESEHFFLQKVPLSRAITHPHKRLQHLAGRYLLQHLYPGFPFHLIEIADTRKPYVPGDPFHFSISHCGNYAAAVVSTRNRVGIDVETPTARVLRIAHKFMSNDEEVLLTASSLEDEVLLKTLFWSAKETLFKWYSLGEVDFKEHLWLQGIQFYNNSIGQLGATVRKNEDIDLQVPFVIWPDVVLTYTCS
jgi:4'-phosphopantetheinyl transferase EntD